MAVSGDVTPVVRPQPNTDPRYPIGLWEISTTGQAGDGSGGTNKVNIVWSKSRTDAIFSVEQITAYIGGSNADEGVTVIIRSRELSSQLQENVIYDGFLTRRVVGESAGSVRYQPSYKFRPDLTTAAWQIDVAITNAAATTLYVAAWGYIWDPAALKDSRGPLIPGDSTI